MFFTSIDDKDPKNKVTHKLSNLLESFFGKENYIENVIWVKNTTHNDAKTFSHNHEYIQSYTRNKDAALQEHEMFRKAKPGFDEVKELIHKLNKEFPSLEKIGEELRDLYRGQEKKYKEEVETLGLEWTEEIQKSNPWKGIKQYKFADYRTADGEYVKPEEAKEAKAQIWVYREGDPSWPNANTLTKAHKNPESDDYRFYQPLHPFTKKPCPAPKRGWVWREKSKSNGNGTSFEELDAKHQIHYGEDENKVPQFKRFLDNVSTDVTKSVLTDFTDGEKELANLIGERGTFPNPKPTTIIQTLLSLSSKNHGYVLDFFAGSGTTAHSTMKINDILEKNLSFILNELGGNMYQTILPRIKKIAYSFDWKDGKPQNMNGLGVFLKYQRLEQYEEALENIAFTAPAEAVQQALAFDQYLPKYFLEFETRGSRSLLNVAAMQDPWNYQLKVWDGYTYDTEHPADLIETFNYLVGLHQQKQFTRQHQGRRYTFVWGWNNEHQHLLVVWRNTQGWEAADYDQDRDYLQSQLPAFAYDRLYVNGQCTLPGALPLENLFKTAMLPTS